MKAARLWRVTRVNLARDRRGFLLSASGVAVGVAAFVFFVALGQGVGEVVRERIFPVEATHVEVVPPSVSLGAFLGGGVLDDAAVARLEALPGVARRWRKMELQVPAVTRYQGDFFGRPLRMGLEVVAVGVDPGYLADDVGTGFADPGPGAGSVPAVVATRLLELYNHSFARARGLPRVDPGMLQGFEFPLTLGASYVTRAGVGVTRPVTLRVAGVSDRALLAGVTLPLETVRRWNRDFVGEDAARRYQSVVLEARSAGEVSGLMQAVRDMGFEVDTSERRLAEEVGAAVRLTTLALTLLSFLILALAAVSIARASWAHVAARTRELGVLRAVGARRGDLRAMVVAEALAAGLAGGLTGVVLAFVGAGMVDLVVGRWLPAFPFKPETFFGFPGWLIPAALGAAALSAVAGALVPARAAARVDPARALQGG